MLANGKYHSFPIDVKALLEGDFAVAAFLIDFGGTIVIHMFGAYFGLGVAWMLGKPTKGEENEASSQVSDLFSFIGTLFLWLYWPTFVAGWLPPGSLQAETAITNTVLALLGSTVSTFILSAALSGRLFRPVDIQNATLAGGVTIGALANLHITPGFALLVGCSAGLLVRQVGAPRLLWYQQLAWHAQHSWRCAVHHRPSGSLAEARDWSLWQAG